ncbi:carbon-nitrogen hydrolase family protein [bacterium]|nr:MAG: carbon-nitrogen hydrolase family protein [bacterium]
MTVTIGVAQFVSTDTTHENLLSIDRMVARAADQGVQLLGFHEIANTSYPCFIQDPKYRELAEPIPGPSTDHASELATRHGVHMVLPLYERQGDMRFNTAAFIEPGKGVVGKYQKSHIARSRVHSPGDLKTADEAYYCEPGQTGFSTWDNVQLGIRIGVQICYDRHFFEGARSLGLQGVDLVFVPTASYRKFIIETLWNAELQAMAFQNTFFVAGINKIGPVTGFTDGRRFPGRSLIVDFEGRVMSQAGDEEALVVADIDPARAQDARDVLRFYELRRPELYEQLTRMDAGADFDRAAHRSDGDPRL